MGKPAIPKVHNSFGKLIRELRLELNLSQTDLAMKTDSSLMTVFSLEKGIRTLMDIKILKNLSKILSISYDTLAILIVEDMSNNLKEYFDIT